MFSVRRFLGHGWNRTNFNIPALIPWRRRTSAGELLKGSGPHRRRPCLATTCEKMAALILLVQQH